MIFSHEQFISNEYVRDNSVIVSLMIPSGLQKGLRRRSGSMNQYIGQLLAAYPLGFLEPRGSKHINRVYQDRGLGLRKLSARVSEENWSRLKYLALILGVSAAFLFVLLVKMDLGDMGRVCREAGVVVVPTFPFVLTITQHPSHNHYLIHPMRKSPHPPPD